MREVSRVHLRRSSDGRFYMRFDGRDFWFAFERRGAKRKWFVDQTGRVAPAELEAAHPVETRGELPADFVVTLGARIGRAFEVVAG